MTSSEEVGRILMKSTAPVKVLNFAALLGRETGLGESLIVVGGSAIEIYTRGDYASGYIDIVGDRARITRALEAWDFVKGGRMWHRKDWGIAVDIVREEYRGDLQRTQVVGTEYGNVRLAAIEDVLAKRLISAKHWKRPEDFEHALLLATRYRDRIDWDYVGELARRDLATDILSELRKRVGSPTEVSTRRE
jgi:hypothetical protein